MQRGLAHAEHDRVGTLDLDAPPDVVHTGRQDEVLAAGELVVDGLDRVRGIGDEEVGDRDRPPRRDAVSPGDAASVAVSARHTYVVAPLVVDEQVRLLPADRCGVERCVRHANGRLLDAGCVAGVVRGADHTGEHLVPHSVGPEIDLAVSGQPLLLGCVDHASGSRVGDEPAAGEAGPLETASKRNVGGVPSKAFNWTRRIEAAWETAPGLKWQSGLTGGLDASSPVERL